MIRLDIHEYCESCCDFDPNVIKPVRNVVWADFNDESPIVLQSDTIVCCKYAKRCECIKRYLERQTGGNNNAD